jgi:hypothetical protein
MDKEPTISNPSQKPAVIVSRPLSTRSATLTRTYSWSAVVRGAVLYGVGGIVHTRKLKQHYGVKLAAPFISGTHDEADAFVDVFYGTKYTRDNVRWLAAKVTPPHAPNILSAFYPLF